ncbi:PLP-dependent transferase [Streptomyces sp. NPDC048430]|uniref:PLP-dependent transferase n=1 Tax=Streptomyces sp. NPDC048430 TaxID=3155388 RepID=UPI003431D62F
MTVFADKDLHHRVWTRAVEYGSTADPFAAWVTLRGIQTLPLRMRQHCENAEAVSRRLAPHRSLPVGTHHIVRAYEQWVTGTPGGYPENYVRIHAGNRSAGSERPLHEGLWSRSGGGGTAPPGPWLVPTPQRPPVRRLPFTQGWLSSGPLPADPEAGRGLAMDA